jgi:hypothetical protein
MDEAIRSLNCNLHRAQKSLEQSEREMTSAQENLLFHHGEALAAKARIASYRTAIKALGGNVSEPDPYA